MTRAAVILTVPICFGPAAMAAAEAGAKAGAKASGRKQPPARRESLR